MAMSRSDEEAKTLERIRLRDILKSLNDKCVIRCDLTKNESILRWLKKGKWVGRSTEYLIDLTAIQVREIADKLEGFYGGITGAPHP